MTTEEYEQMKTSIAKLLERAQFAEQRLADSTHYYEQQYGTERLRIQEAETALEFEKKRAEAAEQKLADTTHFYERRIEQEQEEVKKIKGAFDAQYEIHVQKENAFIMRAKEAEQKLAGLLTLISMIGNKT